MTGRNRWLVGAFMLGLVLVACTPGGVATVAPAETPPPARTPTWTTEVQVDPPATATPEPIVEQVTPSKYDGVYVYTVEEQFNEGRSLLHVAYPVTEHPAINATLQASSEQFIDEFRAMAAEQETAYQDYVRKTGEHAASFVTQYIQHFDVTFADANLISLAIEQYRFTGGTGSSEIVSYLFDRAAGKELAPADLFVSDAYLERLSLLTRQELEQRFRAEAAEADFDTEAARERWLTTMLEMMRSGTEPRVENYDGIVFHGDATVDVQFDKYQVAPGAYGVITVSLPAESVADLLTPKVRQLLGVAAAGPVPTLPSAATREPPATASPSATPEPPPAPTSAPTAAGAAGKVDCAQTLCVALTFDDGPSIYTDGLLDVLQAHGARATFFVLGKSARVQTRTIIRMAKEGHEIGNHSWGHLNIKQLSEEEVREQVDQTNELVAEITGVEPRYFRPPYGAYDDTALGRVHMPVILWSVDPEDWKDRDAEIVAERMREANVGAIILAHDIYASTVEAVSAVLESLSARGIYFVTVSELLAPTEAVSGETYSRRPASR